MLDIKLIRENPEQIKQALLSRGDDIRFDELLSLDADKRKILIEVESYREKRKKLSEEIGKFKREKKILHKKQLKKLNI